MLTPDDSCQLERGRVLFFPLWQYFCCVNSSSFFLHTVTCVDTGGDGSADVISSDIKGTGQEHPVEIRTLPLSVASTSDAVADGKGTDQDGGESHQHADDAGVLSHDMTISLAERLPRFEDPSGHANVTVQLGGTAFLNCKVLDLQDKTVRPMNVNEFVYYTGEVDTL